MAKVSDLNFLFEKESSRQLGLIRLLIGTWFFVDILSMLVAGYVKKAYVEPLVNFPFYGFEWITPLPGIWMYMLFVTLMLAAAAIALGYRMKWFLIYFLIGFGYVFMCDIVYTLNKFYLFLILAFVLLFTEADKNVLFKRETISRFVPRWQVLIFTVLLSIIYIYSGISKINPDWLIHAEPLRFFLAHKIPFKWMSDEVFLYVAYGFTYCGIVFDLSIVALLVNKKTRTIGLVLQAAFHTLNFILLGIGSLSIFTALFTWLLFPTPWLRKKLKMPEMVQKEQIEISSTKKTVISTALIVFLVINLLIPHRHYLTGNNVNWTEKGHRFSWRLMTRSKHYSSAIFYITSDKIIKKQVIEPKPFLTPRQYRKMAGETDLVLIFAHYLRDKYKKEGHKDVKITSRIMTKLNGRPHQLLIDPNLDLAKVKRSLIIDEVSNQLAPRIEL